VDVEACAGPTIYFSPLRQSSANCIAFDVAAACTQIGTDLYRSALESSLPEYARSTVSGMMVLCVCLLDGSHKVAELIEWYLDEHMVVVAHPSPMVELDVIASFESGDSTAEVVTILIILEDALAIHASVHYMIAERLLMVSW
jgi:hypothetical protein